MRFLLVFNAMCFMGGLLGTVLGLFMGSPLYSLSFLGLFTIALILSIVFKKEIEKERLASQERAKAFWATQPHPEPKPAPYPPGYWASQWKQVERFFVSFAIIYLLILVNEPLKISLYEDATSGSLNHIHVWYMVLIIFLGGMAMHDDIKVQLRVAFAALTLTAVVVYAKFLNWQGLNLNTFVIVMTAWFVFILAFNWRRLNRRDPLRVLRDK